MDAGEGKKAKEIHPPSHYRGREGAREEKRWRERESEGPEEEGGGGGVMGSLFWLL